MKNKVAKEETGLKMEKNYSDQLSVGQAPESWLKCTAVVYWDISSIFVEYLRAFVDVKKL